MHVLPRVRELEDRFAGELVVIGVHAGKFSAERVTRNLEAACARLGVHHAVVNDRQFRIWKQYAVRAWPTVALIDAEGMLVGVQSGEFPIEPMADAIARVIERDRSRGVLRPGPDPSRASQRAETGALSFPTRTLGEGDRIWVSDAGHGRVVELERKDAGGSAQTWRVAAEWKGFAEPQGLARLDGSTFVADRRGHGVFRLDDGGGGALRVAGSGRIGEGWLAPRSPAASDIRSPWGLSALPDGSLAIAMAGSHQLWRLERDRFGGFDEATLVLLAGAGGEDIEDGPAADALLAQPTGVAVTGASLAFADSESSAVRVLALDEGRVRTIVGTGLFDFGDRDGRGDEVLLQHAQDLAWRGGELVVADTYNDRLKVVDAGTRECRPHPGEAGEVGSLWEPMGVSAWGDGLLVADTNHHRLCRVTADGGLVPLEIEE